MAINVKRNKRYILFLLAGVAALLVGWLLIGSVWQHDAPEALTVLPEPDVRQEDTTAHDGADGAARGRGELKTLYFKDIRQDPGQELPVYLYKDSTPVEGDCMILYEQWASDTDVRRVYTYMAKTGIFHRGLMQGQWKTITLTGELLNYTEHYKNGLLVGPFVVYNSDSTIHYQTKFKGGNGVWKSFYASGQLKVEGPYRNGLEDGVWREYHPDGTLNEKTYYQKGVLQAVP